MKRAGTEGTPRCREQSLPSSQDAPLPGPARPRLGPVTRSPRPPDPYPAVSHLRSSYCPSLTTSLPPPHPTPHTPAPQSDSIHPGCVPPAICQWERDGQGSRSPGTRPTLRPRLWPLPSHTPVPSVKLKAMTAVVSRRPGFTSSLGSSPWAPEKPRLPLPALCMSVAAHSRSFRQPSPSGPILAAARGRQSFLDAAHVSPIST